MAPEAAVEELSSGEPQSTTYVERRMPCVRAHVLSKGLGK